MAIEPVELHAKYTKAALPTIEPDERGQLTKVYANSAGAELLAVGTPLAVNTTTNKWVLWDSDGTNGTDTIRGFVYPDAVQLHATNDVIAPVFVRGVIKYDAIVLPAGEAENDLKAALRVGLKDLGIDVQGLDGVH